MNVGHHHLEQPIDGVNFYFSPGTANRWWCFLLFQTSFYFSRPFPPFQTINCCYSPLFLHLSVVSQDVSVSGYPAVLQRGQLHFSRMFLVSSLTVPRLADIFFVNIFQQAPSSIQWFFPNKATFLAVHIRCQPDMSTPHPQLQGL